MEREELRRVILEGEVARSGYDLTTLAVNFSDSPDEVGQQSAVWRIEGAAGSIDDIVTDILTDIAVASGNEYPPPFVLDANRGIYSWGADGADWNAILTVGSSIASVVFPVVWTRLAAKRGAENEGVRSEHSDSEALEYARWFLSSTVIDASGNPIAEPDDFALTGEKHQGTAHSFTFTLDGATYGIELKSVAGHPLMVGWERQTN